MRLLIDTHSFLWFVGGSDRLSPKARTVIEDLDNEVLLSVASLWEMAIKVGLEKLKLSGPYGEFIPEQLGLNEIGVLHAELPHLTQYIELPHHHRDPFDRLIIAQAIEEKVPVVGTDSAFGDYDIEMIW